MTWTCPVASGTGNVRTVEVKQGLKCLEPKDSLWNTLPVISKCKV